MELSALDDVNPIIKTSNSRPLLAYRVQARAFYPPDSPTGYFQFRLPVDR